MDGNSISVANKLYESGIFEISQPSFTSFKGIQNTFYTDQWGLNNTGQFNGTSGIDINAPEAWTITRGDSSIRVAVIDQGVDLTHPDLANNLLLGFDATDGSVGGSNGDCSGNDAHGTCCAGIIGAIDNSIGTIGVAPNCRIIPIRVTYTQGGRENWEDDWIVSAVHHAWAVSNADVISCSWIQDHTVPFLDTEINNALTQGRQGHGCIVVFAAGNFNSSISYPSNSNPSIFNKIYCDISIFQNNNIDYVTPDNIYINSGGSSTNTNDNEPTNNSEPQDNITNNKNELLVGIWQSDIQD